jgi:hypothetical protein
LDDNAIGEEGNPNPDNDFSPMENLHMEKHKTFFCYRSQQQLVRAICDKKPVSGILVENESAGQIELDFYLLYKEKQSFCWIKVVFDDSNGIYKGGLWYAPMETVAVLRKPPTHFESIQKLAKMSTVAIPMSYGIGKQDPASEKFCVITNWWKERQSNGRYTMPILDPAWYFRRDNYESLLERFHDTIGNVI